MNERKNEDGSISIGVLEDMPVKAEPKEEKAEKPKKATKKK